MFENVVKLFKPEFTHPLGETTAPHPNVKYRAWVILKDGRIGYIDHYKSDGRFGVRPVNMATGLHYPNISEHWTREQRLAVPEELSLTLKDFRAAEDSEMPPMYRFNAE